MVAPDALGAEGRPFELVIERGKVLEFARAVHAHDLPAHRGEDVVPPPTFLATEMWWTSFVEGADPWERVGMSQERGMHAEQAYRFHGPPLRVGERLVGRARIDAIWTKQGRSGGTLTFVRKVTEFRDADGVLRAEAVLTGVETSRPPEAP